MTIVARQMEDPFGAFTQSLRLKMPMPLKERRVLSLDFPGLPLAEFSLWLRVFFGSLPCIWWV